MNRKNYTENTINIIYAKNLIFLDMVTFLAVIKLVKHIFNIFIICLNIKEITSVFGTGIGSSDIFNFF